MSLNNVVYLASPYTHKDLGVKEQRAKQVARVAGYLISHGFNIFCPIAHSHYIAEHSSLPAASAAGPNYETSPEHRMWMRVDLAILEQCAELYVLMLDGWEASKGVQEEIAEARLTGKQISYLDSQGKIVSVEDNFYMGGA